MMDITQQNIIERMLNEELRLLYDKEDAKILVEKLAPKIITQLEQYPQKVILAEDVLFCLRNLMLNIN